MISVGEILRRLRDSRRRTQRACAEDLGVEEVNWRKWELGERAPSIRSLAGIARVLDLADSEIAALVRGAEAPAEVRIPSQDEQEACGNG